MCYPHAAAQLHKKKKTARRQCTCKKSVDTPDLVGSQKRPSPEPSKEHRAPGHRKNNNTKIKSGATAARRSGGRGRAVTIRRGVPRSRRLTRIPIHSLSGQLKPGARSRTLVHELVSPQQRLSGHPRPAVERSSARERFFPPGARARARP